MLSSARSLAFAIVALTAWLTVPALAQSCRALQIMTSQCTWFALETLGTNKQAADQAEREATSTLVEGCSQGQYQMVLLRGTPVADKVVTHVRSRGAGDAAAVRAQCAVEASRVMSR